MQHDEQRDQEQPLADEKKVMIIPISHSLDNERADATPLEQSEGVIDEDTDARAEDDAGLEAQSAGRRRRRNITVALAALAALLIIVYWYFFSSKPAADQATTDTQVVVSVRTAKAERQPIAAEVSAVGTIFPREQSVVSASVGGRINQMRLLKNQVVRQGEVIAVLDARDIEAQRRETLAALREARLNAQATRTSNIPQTEAAAERDLRDARANVETARALYERRRTLYAQGGIAQRDVEAARLSLTTAEDALRFAERSAALRRTAGNPNDLALANARIQQAQERVRTIDAQLSLMTVRTPLTGIVTDQFQFTGEYAASGARLVTIADLSEVIVKAQFADTVVANLQVGDTATVLPTDLAGERMTGRVSLISRSSDPLNRSVEVWVNLGNGAGRLRPGGAAEVRVATRQTGDAVVVPASAVTLGATNANEGTVMIVDSANVAHETKVTVGIRAPQTVQIVSGLQGGETVVIEGNYALPDGTKVEINNAANDASGGGQ